MIAALVFSAILLAQVTYRFWRVIRERELRWELYAIRDRLRWLAIADEAIRDSRAFERLDRSLSNITTALPRLSLWSMLPRLPSGDERDDGFEADMRACPEILDLYRETGVVLVRHMHARHWLVTMIFKVFGRFIHSPEQRVAKAEERVARAAISGHPSIPAAA